MENTTTTEAAVVKVAKRLSMTLSVGDTKLTVLAQRKAANRAEVVVITTDAKGKTARGMTQRFATFVEAVKALHVVVADAQKKGWQRSQRSGGFKARPDAFSAIPPAPTVSTKGKR